MKLLQAECCCCDERMDKEEENFERHAARPDPSSRGNRNLDVNSHSPLVLGTTLFRIQLEHFKLNWTEHPP